MNDVQVNDIFRDYIRQICEMPSGTVRPSFQNAPEQPEDESYCIVNVLSEECIGEPDVEYDDDYDKLYARHHAKWFLSINFYNKDAFDKALTLKDSFNFSDNRDILCGSGLSYVDTSEVRKLPEVINDVWYDRAQIDVFLYEVSEHEMAKRNISSLEIDLKTEKAETNVIINLE